MNITFAEIRKAVVAGAAAFVSAALAVIIPNISGGIDVALVGSAVGAGASAFIVAAYAVFQVPNGKTTGANKADLATDADSSLDLSSLATHDVADDGKLTATVGNTEVEQSGTVDESGKHVAS